MHYSRVKVVLVEIKEMIIVIFLVVFMMTFVISQNAIPSGSMIPTLNIKDRLIVSMLPYYYRSPQRGEMVVFNGPDGEKWIKRVIGLPGETVDIKEGNIYINGEPLDESSYLPEEGVSDPNPILTPAMTYPYVIPEGCYFLLGDNRLESYDCRYIGVIPEEEITGKAIYRIYPFKDMGSLSS
ncbi:MAG: signal peptidase I [Cellulosilyticum sp.]|nr:signal peptidase I [Cellulosilyticum sp.]MEE1072662.1 signal peptidase I [Cellulosilyticum sp.]